MDTSIHNMTSLFKQLGLNGDTQAIDRFVSAHSPLERQINITDAPFWTATQAEFLKESMAEDADWTEVIEVLDARLRH